MGSPPPGGNSPSLLSPVQSPNSNSNSWVSKAKGSPVSIADYQPDFEVMNGVAKVSIPTDLLDNSVPLWKCFVVGFFMGDAPHVGTIHSTVNRIWTVREKSSRIDVQFINKTTVLFRIENQSTRDHVLKRRYWHISNVPLVINEWNPTTANAPPDLSAMPLWVDLKDVPANLYSHKGLSFLSSTVGKFVKLHPNTERCIRLDVARMLVEVNFTRPLTDKICFEDSNGEPVTVQVSYPWLPPRCNLCSKWGHLVKDCSKKVTILAVDTRKSELEFSKGAGCSNTQLAQTIAQELIQDLECAQTFKPALEGSSVLPTNTDTGTGTTQEGPWQTVTRRSPHASPDRSETGRAETKPISMNGFEVLGKMGEEEDVVGEQELSEGIINLDQNQIEDGELLETDTEAENDKSESIAEEEKPSNETKISRRRNTGKPRSRSRGPPKPITSRKESGTTKSTSLRK